MLASLPWLTRYLGLFSQVDRCLDQVAAKATQIKNPALREQALLSLEYKAFHCYGGAVMALLALPRHRPSLVTIIIYLQTISDYLDNLCDRAGSTDSDAFLRLHQSMLDAVNPAAEPINYYHSYDREEDEYLNFLVQGCQNTCRRLPSLNLIQQPLQQLIEYYSHLQAYKHMDLNQRESHLTAYLFSSVPNPAALSWWELAAATGSTLGMFALLALASRRDLKAEEVESVLNAYFPWICSLHILLDYLIDQEEDIAGGDLNFVSYYDQPWIAWEALQEFVNKSQKHVQVLNHSSLHQLIISGLLAMYLSDRKVLLQGASSQARTLIKSAGSGSLALYHLCRVIRRFKGG